MRNPKERIYGAYATFRSRGIVSTGTKVFMSVAQQKQPEIRAAFAAYQNQSAAFRYLSPQAAGRIQTLPSGTTRRTHSAHSRNFIENFPPGSIARNPSASGSGAFGAFVVHDWGSGQQ